MPRIEPTAEVPQKDQDQLDELLYAREAEIKSLEDLAEQRGTPIPALFNQFYRFIQNPSTVSVETFKRMVDTDDTIGSGVDFLTICLSARMGMYQHKSKEITEFVNKALNEIEDGFTNCVKELLSASWAGFAVQEVVWGNSDLGFVPKRIVTLPPGTIMFETERTGRLTKDGILQYQRNYNPALMGSGVNYLFGFSSVSLPTGTMARPDPFAKLGDYPFPIRTANTYSYMSVRIPTQKCIHYAFDAQGKFGNPYGRSLLRRVYKYYVMKDAMLQMMSIALDRKGTPLTIVYYDPNLTLIDPNKAGSDLQQNVRGQVAGMRAGIAAREAFRNVHNDTTIFLPGKKGQHFETDFVPQDSNTQSFIEGLNFCNKSMMRGLLLPALVFSGGDGTGSYSLGQEHAKTFDKILDGMLAGLTKVISDQFIRPLIAYNFPESAWKKDGIGDFSKRQISPEEVDKEVSILEKAVNMGAIDMTDMNDLNVIRDKLGFEPRTSPVERPDVGEMFGEEEPQQEPQE